MRNPPYGLDTESREGTKQGMMIVDRWSLIAPALDPRLVTRDSRLATRDPVVVIHHFEAGPQPPTPGDGG